MSTATAPKKRQPQLDGLRALALVFVLIHHFGGPFLNHLNLGPFGVRFFFVVSGFLITRILLKTRDQVDAGTVAWGSAVLNFQARRLTRTLPIYWLCLLLAAALGIPPVRESLLWTLTFLTNFYISHIGYFPATISHFWTLAVQEQFYFFWPFFILLLPRSWLRPGLAALMLIPLIFRYWCITTEASYLVRWFNLLGNLDTFAMGAVLAFVSLKQPGLIEQRTTRLWTGGIALGAVLVALYLRSLPADQPITIFIELLESASMGWLIACSVTGFHGAIGRALSWSPLTYLGQISYGIYIYHVLISILLKPVFDHFGFGGLDTAAIAVRFGVLTGVAIVVAHLSWEYIEQPIFKFRERFSR